jgi:hypothetical protein
VKILFIARHFTYFRNYETVIAELARRGHQLHLAAEREEDLGGREMVERLAHEHSGVSFGWVPGREDRWAAFATRLRMTIDYLRYFEPAYAGAPKLRARARERVPRIGLWLVAAAGARTQSGRAVIRTVLQACERAIPRSAAIDAFLRDQLPDVVLFTPLIGVVASPQLDILQSARALGYPTALCVWSWDHLSSKAILRTVPDRVFVWNDTQRDEAITLHGVPADRIVVTGAQCFDQWFERRPSMDHDAFCRKVGLPPVRPFLLYVCSALFQGSASEALFVQRWVRALRASGLEPLTSTPILVRPHPSRLKEWTDVNISAEGDAVLWGRNPVDAEARTDYFDSLYHCEGVVGLNTSAFLEGAIAGRPIFAPLLPEHHENQEGTIHFHYLLHVNGGLLHTARTLGDHVEQLNAALQTSENESERSRRFVEAFIRPRGVDVAASPVFAGEVEKLAAARPARVAHTIGESLGGNIARWLLRAALAPAAALAALDAAAPLMLSEHEREIAARHRAHRDLVAEAWRVKDEHNAEEQEHKNARAAQRQRYKAARAAEWRRTKKMKNLKQRLKKRIGRAS